MSAGRIMARSSAAWQMAANTAVAGSCHRSNPVPPPLLPRSTSVLPPTGGGRWNGGRTEVERRSSGGGTGERASPEGCQMVVDAHAQPGGLTEGKPMVGHAQPGGLTEGSRWSARAKGADHRKRQSRPSNRVSWSPRGPIFVHISGIPPGCIRKPTANRWSFPSLPRTTHRLTFCQPFGWGCGVREGSVLRYRSARRKAGGGCNVRVSGGAGTGRDRVCRRDRVRAVGSFSPPRPSARPSPRGRGLSQPS